MMLMMNMIYIHKVQPCRIPKNKLNEANTKKIQIKYIINFPYTYIYTYSNVNKTISIPIFYLYMYNI